MRQDTLGRDHFEALYAERPDPWRLATSDYERAKYAATLAALPRETYDRGLEIGCATGVFTAALAPRCRELLAVEPVAAALEQARARNAGVPHLRFADMLVPGEWPAGMFDLVVLSEVIDYLGVSDVERLADRLAGALSVGGDLLMVHWVGKRRGRPPGEEASDRLIARLAASVAVLRRDRNPDYRLDLLRRC